jgi:hypothetical protein
MKTNKITKSQATTTRRLELPQLRWGQRAALLAILGGMAAGALSARADTIYIGDAAGQGKNVTYTASTHSLTPLTYVFLNKLDSDLNYFNGSAAAVSLRLTEVNFWYHAGDVAGELVPFVAVYTGADFTDASVFNGSNYQVLSIGDRIVTSAGAGLYNSQFLVTGTNPVITLPAGAVLVAGCTVNVSRFLTFGNDGTPGPVADFIGPGLFLPAALGDPLTGNATDYGFHQTALFNLGMELVVIPEPSAWLLLAIGGTLLAVTRRRP